jgi:hypothetical protein
MCALIVYLSFNLFCLRFGLAFVYTAAQCLNVTVEVIRVQTHVNCYIPLAS